MLTDSHGRGIDYLRISVTDRCNLRCFYCMPLEGAQLLSRDEILSYEEICEIAVIASTLGIRKVRITGGEPLVRREIEKLISALSKIESLDDISLTTNGVLLEELAGELKSSGLCRVNISADSLRKDRFREITGRNALPAVLRGIEKALEVGLSPVKLNVVVMRGVNNDELLSFAHLSKERPLHVRFIEFMDFGKDGWRRYYPEWKMKEELSRLGPLHPLREMVGNGPAQYFKYDNSLGTIGFISPISESFCSTCNRIRLTADGYLKPCLVSDTRVSLKPALRGSVPQEPIESLFRTAVGLKPLPHSIEDTLKRCRAQMYSIGG